MWYWITEYALDLQLGKGPCATPRSVPLLCPLCALPRCSPRNRRRAWKTRPPGRIPEPRIGHQDNKTDEQTRRQTRQHSPRPPINSIVALCAWQPQHQHHDAAPSSQPLPDVLLLRPQDVDSLRLAHPPLRVSLVRCHQLPRREWRHHRPPRRHRQGGHPAPVRPRPPARPLAAHEPDRPRRRQHLLRRLPQEPAPAERLARPVPARPRRSRLRRAREGPLPLPQEPGAPLPADLRPVRAARAPAPRAGRLHRKDRRPAPHARPERHREEDGQDEGLAGRVRCRRQVAVGRRVCAAAGLARRRGPRPALAVLCLGWRGRDPVYSQTAEHMRTLCGTSAVCRAAARVEHTREYRERVVESTVCPDL